MANALYHLGIPPTVYLALVFISIVSILGLFYIVWVKAPPAPVGGGRRRRGAAEEEEGEEPPRKAARRQVPRAQQAQVEEEEGSDEDGDQEGPRRLNERRPLVPRGGRRGLDRMHDVQLRARRGANRGQQEGLAAEGAPDGEVGVEGGEDAGGLPEGLLKKVGKKKAEKLKAKEEKKLAHQAELDARAEKKKRDDEMWEERKRKEAEKEAERRKEEEEEERLRIEREKKEEEEYNLMKASFSVEGEGYSAESDKERKAKLAEFAAYVKKLKVVPLEDLSAKFLLRTNDVIGRLKQLEKDGVLSGVIDDRGKYIYITAEELDGVAKFIKRRGRVSVEEIVAESNRLITFPQ